MDIEMEDIYQTGIGDMQIDTDIQILHISTGTGIIGYGMIGL
jgi:hypothetical protein